MTKACKIIPTEIKSQILAELALPGSSVSELAKIYKISTKYIYNLRRKSQTIKPIDKPSFVELAVKNSDNFSLKNASLTFANFSLVLEGGIKSSSLIAILKILEEQSC
jgi:transposase-like protein